MVEVRAGQEDQARRVAMTEYEAAILREADARGLTGLELLAVLARAAAGVAERLRGVDAGDRSHFDCLKGRRVRLTLHPWARQGPTEGVLLGRGEWGITLRVEGGGRWVYRYGEVDVIEGVR